MAQSTTRRSTKRTDKGIPLDATRIDADAVPSQSAAKKAKRTVKKAAVDAATSARDTAQDTVSALSAQAGQLADDAISQGRTEADRLALAGKSQTEDFLRSIGRAIDAGSQSLENDGMARTASYVRAAAHGLDRAATEVDGLQPTSLTRRVEDVVRSNPLLTVGALALAGFAMAGAMKNKNDR